jgi:hypothetical protein
MRDLSQAAVLGLGDDGGAAEVDLSGADEMQIAAVHVGLGGVPADIVLMQVKYFAFDIAGGEGRRRETGGGKNSTGHGKNKMQCAHEYLRSGI